MGLRYLEITGGNPLYGELAVQGSKNAALPILAACLLGEGPCMIENCPSISDVLDLQCLMGRLGCRIQKDGNSVLIDGRNACGYTIKGREAARIRSSILFLGALLGKMGKAVLPHPGGCAIGERPIDIHMEALQKLGAVFSFDNTNLCDRENTVSEVYEVHAGCRDETAAEVITAYANRLKGACITLAYPSVGATENVILAAVMAEGITVLKNAAREPEIDELCAFLNLRGAKILRLSDGAIRICGVKKLCPVKWQLRSDRIVTGTYLLSAAAAGGKLRIRNAVIHDIEALLPILHQMGAQLECRRNSILIEMKKRCRAIPYLETAPYPGFPTDLQSPLMAVLSVACGKSMICETVFENRFRTADELKKMGACIAVKNRCACICGRERLYGTDLEAPDLRGGAALVTAALAAEGTSRIYKSSYIERGYEDICRDLGGLGAEIRENTEG